MMSRAANTKTMTMVPTTSFATVRRCFCATLGAPLGNSVNSQTTGICNNKAGRRQLIISCSSKSASALSCFSTAAAQADEVAPGDLKEKSVAGGFTTADGRKIKIFAGIALERPALVVPPLTERQKQYNDILAAIEVENSLLSDYEMRQRAEQELLKKTSDSTENLGQIFTWETEEEWVQQKKQFMDKNNFDLDAHNEIQRIKRNNSDQKYEGDHKSLLRHADRRLLLMVRRSFGIEGYKSEWLLPALEHRPGEPLRQTADRFLADEFGSSISAVVMGNAPSLVVRRTMPNKTKSHVNNADQTMTFYYKAQILPTNFERVRVEFQSKNDYLDYRWLTQDELKNLSKYKYDIDKKYAKKVLQMLCE